MIVLLKLPPEKSTVRLSLPAAESTTKLPPIEAKGTVSV